MSLWSRLMGLFSHHHPPCARSAIPPGELEASRDAVNASAARQQHKARNKASASQGIVLRIEKERLGAIDDLVRRSPG